MNQEIKNNQFEFTLNETKKEWKQGLYIGSIVTFIIVYIWFRFIV